MKKNLVLLLVSLVLCLPVAARKVSGTVEGEGTRLPGVIVTDGYRFTRTDAKGAFTLDTHKDARFVYVVTPSGYTADYSTGAPQFYLPLKGTKRFAFSLVKTSDSPDYTLLSVSDPQMQNDKHFTRFTGAPLGDLRGTAAKYAAQRTTVGIALGDIAWNRLGMFDRYKEAIAKTRIPFYAVIGNHDFIQNQSGIAAGAAFEAAFGPYNWAFFVGNDLVIGLNNILFTGSGLDDPEKSSNHYTEGYSEEALGFVKGILAYVGKDTHLYIAQHSPTRFFYADQPVEGGDRLLSLLDGYTVDILSGHTHYMDNTVLAPGIVDHNAGAVGGAWWATDWCRDGTPRGYAVFSSVGGERSRIWHNIDYPDDFQVEFIDIARTPRHPNSVMANVWDWDPSWTVEWYEDGRPMGAAEQTLDVSPSYVSEISAVYKGETTKIPRYKRPRTNIHYFAATPSQYARTATMVVTAPDGRRWQHDFDLRGYVDLQAHRGGAGLMPENTFTSMRNAMDLGVNTLEMDLQISGDGQVVVSHDNYFHPRYAIRPDGSYIEASDPKEYLYTMPYDSIARYETGLRPSTVWPEKKNVSEHKPLASDLIDFVENYTREKHLSPMRYNIEIKSRAGKGEGTNWPEYRAFVDTCIPLLLSKGLGDRLAVQCFDVRALEYMREKYPEVVLSFLTSKDPDIEEILGRLSFTPEWWSPHHSVISRENVAYCHALGIKVVPWTVDDPAEIQQMVDCGVDAIISNYPDRLIDVIR